MQIQVNNFNKSYGSNQVLTDVSFQCQQGDTLVLLGASGAGKSTLLKMLNLLESPDTGLLKINEQTFDFQNSIPTDDARTLRQKVGMIFQQYHLWPHLNVLSNLIEAPMQVLKLSKRAATKEAKKLLATFNLENKETTWPLQLSGGQQQRIAIARALMMKPDILLFDEPTAALDPESTQQVANIINDLKDTGITQVIVTHDIAFAKKIASHILYLEDGKVIEYGKKSRFEAPKTTAFSNYLTH